MKKPVVLWATLPESERATEPFLAATGWRVRSPYLRKYIRALRRDNSCQAVTRWHLNKRYFRCTNTAATGEQFCAKHGGLLRGTVRSRIPSQFAPVTQGAE